MSIRCPNCNAPVIKGDRVDTRRKVPILLDRTPDPTADFSVMTAGGIIKIDKTCGLRQEKKPPTMYAKHRCKNGI